MQEEATRSIFDHCGDTTARDRSNLRLLMCLLAAWALSFAGVSQLIKREILAPGPLAWTLAILPAILGLAMMVAYARYLREADELQRVIHLRALAIGFGGTYVLICTYRVFERLGAPELGLGDIALLMAILYSIAILVGRRRYL